MNKNDYGTKAYYKKKVIEETIKKILRPVIIVGIVFFLGLALSCSNGVEHCNVGEGLLGVLTLGIVVAAVFALVAFLSWLFD